MVERDIVHGMPAKQFLLWYAYSQMEPFGERRADVRAAQIAAMVFNMAVAAEDRKPLNDFLLDWDKAYEEWEKQQEEAEKPPPRRQTPEEQLAIAYMWARAVANTVEG